MSRKRLLATATAILAAEQSRRARAGHEPAQSGAACCDADIVHAPTSRTHEDACLPQKCA